MAFAATTDELVLVGPADLLLRAAAKAGAEGDGVGEQRSFMVSHGGRSLKFALVKTFGPAAVAVERVAGWSRAERVPVMAYANGLVGAPKFQHRASSGWTLDPWGWVDDPWGWVDDPWGWVDDPWGWVDDPVTVPLVVSAGSTPAEGEAMFWQQGAFQKLGLTDATGARTPALADHLGEGVLVGLFDALPAQPVNLPWLTRHPANGPVQAPNNGATDLSDHGLMCASLVHAVAPRSAVHLYEACGKDGQGRLFPLLEAISAFIDLAAGRPAVISLSLGSPDATGSAALRALLQKATDLGMVVCAAAGNLARWIRKPSALQAAQVPAAFPNVIAVAAANGSDQRATYSQRGDIAAPGGEDLGQPGPDDAEDIIGIGVSTGTSGYVRMDAGTSFATPLVAGAAALVLEGRSAGDASTHTRVLAALQAGARLTAAPGPETLTGSGLGAGILYLPALFNQ